MSVRTWKEIKKQAKKCKNNVEKNYTLGIYEQWGYYFAKAIITPYKDIKRNKTLSVAPKPKGNKVKLTIPQKEYTTLAKNLIKFCEKKGRMPNYLTYKNKKIRCRLYVYMFSKILVYYNEHKKLPTSIDINYKQFYPPTTQKKETKTDTASKVESKLHEYLTDEGCKGMGQCTPYFCACNSLQQCFYRLTGVWVSEYKIAGYAATTSDGTDHPGINTAVAQLNREYGKNVKITWYNFSDLGNKDSEKWNKISNFIKNGAVFFHIEYRRQWGHYEPIKWVSDDLEILNSLGDRCGDESYCGYIEYRDKSEQIDYINGISQKSVAVLTNR